MGNAKRRRGRAAIRDHDLFTRWFTVETVPFVVDVGRGRVEEAEDQAG